MADWNERDKQKARARVREVLSGARGTSRNAVAKLAAARFILGEGSEVNLANVPDDALLAEVARRGIQAPSIDLDAAEKAMEVRRDGEG